MKDSNEVFGRFSLGPKLCRHCNEQIRFNLQENQWIHVKSNNSTCYSCPFCGHRGSANCLHATLTYMNSAAPQD